MEVPKILGRTSHTIFLLAAMLYVGSRESVQVYLGGKTQEVHPTVVPYSRLELGQGNRVLYRTAMVKNRPSWYTTLDTRQGYFCFHGEKAPAYSISSGIEQFEQLQRV